jgi:hypothetical protein
MPQLAGAGSERLTSLLVTVEVTAFVVGPAVGGLLLGVGGGAPSVTAAAVLAVLAVPLLVGLDSGPVAAGADHRERGRWAAVLRSPGVPVAIGVVALVNFALSAASVGLLGLSYGHWAAGDRGFGLATAALGFGSLTAPLVGLLVRLRGAVLLTGSGLALAGAAPGVSLAAGPLVLAGGSATWVECLSTDVLQHAVPDRVRAFALGLTDSVMVLAAALGALLAPLLVRAVGPVPTFVTLGLLLVASVVALARARRRSVRPADALPLP